MTVLPSDGGTSEHSYMIVQIVNFSIDPLGMNVIMHEGYKKILGGI